MEYFYKGVRYSPPTNTDGLLREQPKSASKSRLSESALATMVSRGAMAMMAPAHHRTLFAAHVAPNVKEGMTADVELLRAKLTAQSKQLPDRASFSGKKKGFQRGDRVFHLASGSAKGTVLGASSSKPGFLKVAINGSTFRVHPDNLKHVGG